MRKNKQVIKTISRLCLILSVVCAPLILYSNAWAEPTYKSTNYGVDEVFMGGGGLNDATSGSYQARASLGDMSVGNSASTNYQVYGGFTTTAEPYISLIVNAINVNLGYLNIATAATTSATFQVKAYLASGYMVVNGSDLPVYTSGGATHYLAALTSPSISSPGTEQFGINLVANTDPTTFGADPVQIPDATYSYGTVATDYATTNYYKYVKGDAIAGSSRSSGYTEYTVSYLYNISQVTPAGEYYFNHIIVATATY